MPINAACDVRNVRRVFVETDIFGENSLRRTLHEYMAHYHGERNHQGKDNVLLFPVVASHTCDAEGTIACRERLGGLLKCYHRNAA